MELWFPVWMLVEIMETAQWDIFFFLFSFKLQNKDQILCYQKEALPPSINRQGTCRSSVAANVVVIQPQLENVITLIS